MTKNPKTLTNHTVNMSPPMLFLCICMRVYASGNATRALNTLMNTTSYHFYSVLAEPKFQEYLSDFISAWK